GSPTHVAGGAARGKRNPSRGRGDQGDRGGAEETARRLRLGRLPGRKRRVAPTITVMTRSSADTDPRAVLVSGGLDSAILLGESLRAPGRVFPLYIRCGLFWEDTELEHLRGFLDAIRTPALQPLHVLEMPVRDLYADHW